MQVPRLQHRLSPSNLEAELKYAPEPMGVGGGPRLGSFGPLKPMKALSFTLDTLGLMGPPGRYVPYNPRAAGLCLLLHQTL